MSLNPLGSQTEETRRSFQSLRVVRWSNVILIERLAHVLINTRVLWQLNVKQLAARHHVGEAGDAQPVAIGRVGRFVLCDHVARPLHVHFHVLLVFQEKHQLWRCYHRAVGLGVPAGRAIYRVVSQPRHHPQNTTYLANKFSKSTLLVNKATNLTNSWLSSTCSPLRPFLLSTLADCDTTNRLVTSSTNLLPPPANYRKYRQGVAAAQFNIHQIQNAEHFVKIQLARLVLVGFIELTGEPSWKPNKGQRQTSLKETSPQQQRHRQHHHLHLILVLVMDGSGDGQQFIESLNPIAGRFLVGRHQVVFPLSGHDGEAAALPCGFTTGDGGHFPEEAHLPRPHLVYLHQFDLRSQPTNTHTHTHKINNNTFISFFPILQLSRPTFRPPKSTHLNSLS